MTLEAALADLIDPERPLSAKQLVNLSLLDPEELRVLNDAWPTIDATRRVHILNDLADLAQDNVELNFDAVFKAALDDEEPYVRAAGLRGLFEYEGRDLIRPLGDLLHEDTDTDVRREAAVALGRYATAAELGYFYDGDVDTIREFLMESAENLDEDEHVRARAIEALGAISGEETDNLIESIYEEDSIWLKVGAVDGMGRSANEAWLPIVLREMENRAPEMRHAAAFAAGGIGNEGAVADLKSLVLTDPDRQVQLAAIHALAEIGGPKARVALSSLLYEGVDELRETIEEAIGEMTFEENPLSPPS